MLMYAIQCMVEKREWECGGVGTMLGGSRKLY